MNTQVVEKKAVEEAFRGLELLVECADMDALSEPGSVRPTDDSPESVAYAAGENAAYAKVAKILALLRAGKRLPAGLGLSAQRAQLEALSHTLREEPAQQAA